MHLRVRLQLAEAFGQTNRWYCSEDYGWEVNDSELLLRFYIENGGAEDFARRYDQAMGALNRWYCSEFYGRDIRDPEILWDYYMSYADARNRANAPEGDRFPRRASTTAMTYMACQESL